ncbi:MAG: glycoside hydrolase [Bacilli bacterium]
MAVFPKLGADGNPEGIGLSMWRFNIGGGTRTERRKYSAIPAQSRIVPHQGRQKLRLGKMLRQIYFAKKAKQYGCGKLLHFQTPRPFNGLRNGQGYGEKGDNSANLKQDCYRKFADYMADVAKTLLEK